MDRSKNNIQGKTGLGTGSDLHLREETNKPQDSRLWIRTKRNVEKALTVGTAALLLSIAPALISCGGGGSSSGPITQQLTVATNIADPITMDVGQNQQINAIVSGGTSPFTFNWTVKNGTTCPGSNAETAESFTYTPSAETPNCEFNISVTDSKNATAQSTTAQITVNNTQPITTNNVYAVTNNSLISIIVSDELVPTLTTNAASGSIAANQNARYIYYIQSADIGLIDSTTNTLSNSIPLTMQPCCEIFAPNGGMLYILGTINANGNMTTINTSNNQISSQLSLPVAPTSMSISPNGIYLYAADGFFNSPEGVMINTTTNAITAISVNTGGNSSFSPDSSQLYISLSNSIAVVSTATAQIINTITGLPGDGGVPGFAGAAVFTPDGKKAYVGNKNFNGNVLIPSDVSVINTSDGTISSTIPEGLTPDYLAMTPDGKYVYVVNVSSIDNDTETQVNLDIIDTSNDTVTNTIPLATFNGTSQNGNGSSPVNAFNQILFSYDGTEAYTFGSALNANAVVYINNTTTQTLKTTLQLSGAPVSFTTLQVTTTENEHKN